MNLRFFGGNGFQTGFNLDVCQFDFKVFRDLPENVYKVFEKSIDPGGFEQLRGVLHLDGDPAAVLPYRQQHIEPGDPVPDLIRGYFPAWVLNFPGIQGIVQEAHIENRVSPGFSLQPQSSH